MPRGGTCRGRRYLMYRQIHGIRIRIRYPESGRGRRRPLRLRPSGRRHPLRPARPGGPAGTGRRGARPVSGGRLRVRRARHAGPRRGGGLPGPAAQLGRLHLRRRFDLGGHGGARGRRDRRRSRERGPAGVRLDGPRGREGRPPHRHLRLRRPRPAPVRGPLRPHPDRQVRDGRPPPHAPVRHDDRAVGRGGGPGTGERGAEPRRDVPRPGDGGRRPVRPDDRRPLHETALLSALRRRRGGPRRPRSTYATAARPRCGSWVPGSTSRTPRCPSGTTSRSPRRR